jgi:hypothetical protein
MGSPEFAEIALAELKARRSGDAKTLAEMRDKLAKYQAACPHSDTRTTKAKGSVLRICKRCNTLLQRE